MVAILYFRHKQSPPQNNSVVMEGTCKANVYIADGILNSTVVSKKKERKERKPKSYYFFAVCEALLLSFLMMLIIGIFSIPTVYYGLPPEQPKVRIALPEDEV